jgi:hypothetical protein
MDIDIDCEFLEDGRTIELISIALVAEDGSEFYAINEDMPLGRIAQHKWLMTHVMPYLPLTAGPDGPWDTEHPDIQFVLPREAIAEGARKFITRYTDPCLWADHGAYDHVVLAQLFGPMMALPHGVPMWTADTRQEARRLGNPREPQQLSGLHHALMDARHQQSVRRFLRDYEKEQISGCI